MSIGPKYPLHDGIDTDPFIWASTPGIGPRVNPVMTRMQYLAALSNPEIELLRGLSSSVRQHSAQAELCTERRTQAPRFLLSGWACQQRLLGDGRRQIIQFLVRGDLVGSIVNSTMASTSSVVALTPVTLTDARPVLELLNAPPSTATGIVSALWQMHKTSEASLYNQIIRLGRQTAYERVLHFMLEVQARLEEIGQTSGNSFEFPFTQQILSDALGLSLVHVNRTLQQVRRDGMVEIRGGRVTLLRPDAIKELADWDYDSPYCDGASTPRGGGGGGGGRRA